MEHSDQVVEAMVIIYNSIKIGRPLFEFKRWDVIDYDARKEALKHTDWILQAVKEHIPFEEAREMQSVTYGECL